ncbi:hypothetical protein GCM10022396_10240 [Flavivirga amylovorans]
MLFSLKNNSVFKVEINNKVLLVDKNNNVLLNEYDDYSRLYFPILGVKKMVNMAYITSLKRNAW